MDINCLPALRAFYPSAHASPGLMIEGFCHQIQTDLYQKLNERGKDFFLLTLASLFADDKIFFLGNGEKDEITRYLQNIVAHLLFSHPAIISFQCA